MGRLISSPDISGRSGLSLVWIIPLVSALVGGWLIVKTLSEQGPVATISFLTADGIEVGKTRIKYKNVDIGVVDAIRFSNDFSHIMLTAKFNQGMESFLRRDTRFWVVKPQLGMKGVSGLSTLVSGTYIEIEPGQGAHQFHFVGLEKPPVVLADAVGRKIILTASSLGSVDTGSPVYYRGILAGEVLGYELANDHRSVYIHAFVSSPYDQLIKGNTRFWNVSGMDISVNADGLSIRTQSLQSMLFGGIAFETPDTLEQTSEDVDDLVYTLYEDYNVIQERVYAQKINYIAYFDSSVRGLNTGAPVEFQGIRVGSVLDFRLEYDGDETGFQVPVLIEIEPERIVQRNGINAFAADQTLDTLIGKGLRARLQTGSLLTGQLFVELIMEPDSPARFISWQTRLPEIPTTRSAGFEAVTRSLEDFISKFDTIKIEEISRELLGTLEGTNKLFNSSAIQGSIDDLEFSMQSFRNILQSMDNSDLGATITAGRDVLEKMRRTLELANTTLQPNSPLQYNMIQMTGELEEAARSIRSLVETLERNPQSLIFGKDSGGE